MHYLLRTTIAQGHWETLLLFFQLTFSPRKSAPQVFQAGFSGAPRGAVLLLLRQLLLGQQQQQLLLARRRRRGGGADHRSVDAHLSSRISEFKHLFHQSEIINGSQIGVDATSVAYRGISSSSNVNEEDDDDDGGFGAIVGGPSGSYELVNLQQLGETIHD